MQSNVVYTLSEINDQLYQDIVSEATDAGYEDITTYVIEANTELTSKLLEISDMVGQGEQAIYDAVMVAIGDELLNIDMEGTTFVDDNGDMIRSVDLATKLVFIPKTQTLAPLGQLIKPVRVVAQQNRILVPAQQNRIVVPAQQNRILVPAQQQDIKIQARAMGQLQPTSVVKQSPIPQTSSSRIQPSSTRISAEDTVFYKELESYKMDLIRDIYKTLSNSTRAPRKKEDLINEIKANVLQGKYSIDDIRSQIPQSATPVKSNSRASTPGTNQYAKPASSLLAPTTQYGGGVRVAAPLPLIQLSVNNSRTLPGMVTRLSASAQLYIDAIGNTNIDDIIGALKMYVPIGANSEKYLRDNIRAYETVINSTVSDKQTIDQVINSPNPKAILNRITDQDLLLLFNVYLVHTSREDLINKLIKLINSKMFFKPLSNSCSNIDYELQADTEGLVAYGTIFDHMCFSEAQVVFDGNAFTIMLSDNPEDDLVLNEEQLEELRLLTSTIPSYQSLYNKL